MPVCSRFASDRSNGVASHSRLGEYVAIPFASSIIYDWTDAFLERFGIDRFWGLRNAILKGVAELVS